MDEVLQGLADQQQELTDLVAGRRDDPLTSRASAPASHRRAERRLPLDDHPSFGQGIEVAAHRGGRQAEITTQGRRTDRTALRDSGEHEVAGAALSVTLPGRVSDNHYISMP